MNRRQARKMRRRMLRSPPLAQPSSLWTPSKPAPPLAHLLRQADGFQLKHNVFMDETPPERERYSGCLNLSAQARNLDRLRYQIAPAARTIFCGKYTLAFIKEALSRRA